MKVTVALLALTVLFALAASQGPRRHTYDIDQGVPSWQFGPVTFTAGPNTRGDWGAGLRIPGLVNLGGHAGLTGDGSGPHAGARIKVPGFGRKVEAKVRGPSGAPTAFAIPWI